VIGYIWEKLGAAARELRRLPDALALVWRTGKAWTIAWAALLVIQGLLPVGTVYLSRPMVNQALAAIHAGGAWAFVRPALMTALALGAIAALTELLRGLMSWIRTQQSERAQDYITGLIHRKSVEVDLAFYDSAEFFDRLHRARSEASYRPVQLLETLGGLLQNSVTLIAMLGVLAPFGVWLPLALLASTLPALYVVLRQTVRQHEWALRVTQDERFTWYFDWLLTSHEAAAELRLFNLGGRFQSVYESIRARLRGEKLKLARGEAVGQFGAGAVALLMSGACTVWMLWRAIRGLISPGDLALFYQALQQGLGLMRALLENLGKLYHNSLFLGNLFDFLALRPSVTNPRAPRPAPGALKTGIRFDHVTFSYPGGRSPTLRDFSLTIPAGRIASFVGPNGAGKSTFVKLLCRFYDPEAGKIEMDGVDLRELALDDLRRTITVLFQEPVRYNAKAGENIGLGDAGSSMAAIVAAAEAAGADEIVARLPAGYETLLGKTFVEGVELSTGQWQRVAMARAFLRRAPVLILDEPTSAMDPWAEAEWFDRLRALAAGRTAILITHRLTTAMRADGIYVLRDGAVVESGTHEQLLSRGGFYAQSWARQAAGL
jgi:ATP-binding cassette subfamily B protein